MDIFNWLTHNWYLLPSIMLILINLAIIIVTEAISLTKNIKPEESPEKTWLKMYKYKPLWHSRKEKKIIFFSFSLILIGIISFILIIKLYGYFSFMNNEWVITR